MMIKETLIWVLFGWFCEALDLLVLGGSIRTECRNRHFWLFVKSDLMKENYRLEVQGEYGVSVVQGQWAAECGYTLLLNSWGDLTLRVSYLACAVENQGDSEFQLMLWFVNEGLDEEDISYHPLLLSCRPEEPWRPREVICEENYMEVSVEKPLPADDHKGTEWVTPAPTDDALREWRVLFRVPDLRGRWGSGWTPGTEGQNPVLKEELIPGNLVHLLGYSINITATRIVLRCPYRSRLSYTLQDGEVSVEVVSASIIYRHQWTLLRVDASVACSTTQAGVDGADVVWMLPWLPPPLVLPPIFQKTLKVAVGGRYITQCMAQHRGYRIHDNNGTIEIRMPFGAEGGHLKSGVSEGRYFRVYEVEVELLSEWKDSAWKHTQHCTFRTLRTHQNHTTVITNYIAPPGRELRVSVGVFLSDVQLANVTVGERVFSLEEAERNTVQISQVPFNNGTHSYLLQVPFNHPLIVHKYVGEGYRSYSLSLRFSFLLSPDGEVFQVPASIHSVQQDAVLPFLEGMCMEHGVRILVHYGNLQGEGTVYVAGRKLDWQLVQNGWYSVDVNEDLLTVEIPLFAPGMDYRGLDLHGLAVSVVVSLVHPETMEEYTHLQECILPVDSLLMCLPEGQIMVLLDMSVFTPVDPKHTSLLDPSCGPLDTDSSRVLFSFPAASCGSVVTRLEGHVIYTNEVRHLFPDPALIRPHPHLAYSVPLMCVYPESGSLHVSIYVPRSTVPPSTSVNPLPQKHIPHRHSQEIKERPLPAGG